MNFNSIFQNQLALERQLISILTTNFVPYSSGKNYYNFRCNICGDSKKNKYKRRGYLLKKEGKQWHYFCHNGDCQASMSATKWMKEYFPLYYKEYIREILSNKKEYLIKPAVAKKIEISEKDDIKFFIPILKGNGELFDKAIDLCKNRLIPENIWNKWFIAIDGKYKNRLVIPFFDNKGKIYYWQGLKLKEWMLPKYLSRIGENFNSIYNYYNINRNEPIQIVEGVIDSLFLQNSIALTGLKTQVEKIKQFKNIYFLLDNDISGKKESLKLLEQSKYIFNWFQFEKDYNLPKREKWDINDVCIYLNKSEGFKFEEIKKYYTNSIYNKIFLKI
jgi:hypothetical protein